MLRSFVALCLLFALFCLSVPAQIGGWADCLGGRWNNPTSALIGTMLFNRTTMKAATRPAEKGTRAASRPAPLPTFKPVAADLMVNPLADSLATRPEERRQLAGLFRDVLKGLDSKLREKGHSRDVAMAASIFLSATWSVSRQKEVDDDAMEAMSVALREHLRTQPTFQTMGDRQRQQLYESLILLGVLCSLGEENAKTSQNATQLKTFKDLAGSLFQTLTGVSPAMAEIGPRGLTFR